MSAFRLYFDDSGSRIPDEESIERKDGIDGFALGGLLIDESDLPSAYEMHKEFVERWELKGPLHSTKIRGFRGQFQWLRVSPDRERFLEELEQLLLALPAVGIACVVHRPGYNARYRELHGDQRWRMCKTAAAILIERSAKFAESRGANLRIVFEECGKQEDRDVMQYASDLKKHGMPFDNATSAGYDGLKPEDFRRIILGEPKRIKKQSGVMQFADLYLYPMIKGGYDKSYGPYVKLKEHGKLIDCHLLLEEIPSKGIKYSCFT